MGSRVIGEGFIEGEKGLNINSLIFDVSQILS